MDTSVRHKLVVELWSENATTKNIIYKWVLEEIAERVLNGVISGSIRGCNWELQHREEEA